MDTPTQQSRDYRFAIGLLAGTVVGAGLALWLAPKARTEIRERLTDRMSGAADGLTTKAQGVRDQMADAVVRGAHQVEAFAKAAKNA